MFVESDTFEEPSFSFMKSILITGATGFIGIALVQKLLMLFPEVQIHILTRNKKPSPNKQIEYYSWDIDKQLIDTDLPSTIEVVIHLAGANIAEKKWTKTHKKELVDSRVKSTQLLVNWINEKGVSVETFISASAIGFYGEGTNGKIFKETDKQGDDFLADLCVHWENACKKLINKRIRVVHIRTGIVLDKNGGMWQKLSTAFKLHIVPQFASGQQFYSWISLEDLINLYIFSLENIQIVGPINAVAPNPMTQLDLCKILIQKSTSKFIIFPIPAFLLRLLLGELSVELLKSANVSAQKIQLLGFQFLHEKP